MNPRTDEKVSLARVVQDLMDNFLVLFREHLRLFGTELRRDGSIAARYFGAMLFFATILLLAYVLLNLCVILFAGWALGLPGMAFSALLLTLTNAGFALRALRNVAERFDEDKLGLRFTSAEIERSRTWMTQET